MSHGKLWTRMGLFALLLSVIALSFFGSLVAANRALADADERSVVLDSRGAALVAERELRILAESLEELFDPLLLPATARSATPPRPAQPPRNFDAVWVMDTLGRVAWTTLPDSVVSDAPATAMRAAAEGASASSVRVIGADTSTPRQLLLVYPLTHRGIRLGLAAGSIRADRFLHRIRDTAADRGSLTLRTSGARLAVVGEQTPSAARHVASTPIDFPGDHLELEVSISESGQAVRTILWTLAALALAGLVVGLLRERRNALSLAGRTAELERLYQEVARSNRMKSEFLANVSHELRTPLNAVVGFVEMLREGVYGELTPRQALPVDRIAASATHLRHLVDRLLDIAKIAAGRLEVHPEPLIVRPFVLNVASEMESLVSERGLALSIAVSPTLPRIRTDQTHLRQILINLIGNAVKYTPSGGIQVRARLIGPGTPEPQAEDGAAPDVGAPPEPERLWLALHVSDTGIGIAPTDTGRIFDEFEQVNAGARTDSARRGTGLGLAISRRLARLLGGELTVTSELGKGSIFTVWLPVDPTEPKQD